MSLNPLKWFTKKSEPLPAPMHKDNVLLITAYIKRGTIVMTYQGKVKTAHFEDNTLRNMMKGIRFRKHAESFVSAIAQLLEPLTKQ